LVERVIGRMGYGRAAISSAMSGSWLGLVAGLVFVVVSPDDFVTPILAGLLIGAGAGMVVGMILFTVSKGTKRNFRSVQQVIAKQYDVVVSTAAHAAALAAMKAGSETEAS
jgi:ABC-type enterochelin transport system permease subunit